MGDKASILGVLKGPIASFKEKSRNGRTYTEGFWDTIFNRDLFKEGLENKMFFGQLYHPDNDEEYSQIHCDDRSAVVLTDVEKKNKEYIGTFEILPTKSGHCLRNLLDIGCNFGVSSRGLSDYDLSVFDTQSAESYDVITWDIVAFPGIESCRLKEVYPAKSFGVSEGFKLSSKNKKQDKVKIIESLTKLSKDDKYLYNYIKDTLKAKDDYKNKTVNKILEKYCITESDLEEYGLNYNDLNNDNILLVEYDGQGKNAYCDSIEGKKKVLMPKDTIKYPKALYLVDGIVFDDMYDTYIAYGDCMLLS